MSKEDLRVKRTHRLLQEAFIQLVTKHGYEKVSVRDITNQAQVGYKTFYRHYKGKEGLLNAILEDLINSLRTTLDHTLQAEAPLQNLITSLTFTKENADLFLALTNSPASDQLLKPMLEAALQEGALFLSNKDIPQGLAIFHFASSIDALIKWWLKEGMPYSIEEMAIYINHLVLQPIESLN